MTAMRDDAAGAGWRKAGALVLAVAAVGLPVNNISDYALLLVLAVVIFCGDVRANLRAWMAAVAIVVIAALGQAFLSPARVDEGHNVFLPSAALERQLPSEVYRYMAADFDSQYPPARRCDPKKAGCWLSNGFPDSIFAFSADGIWRKAEFSRAVSGIDFSDPVWLRPSFVNELRYNWTADNDVKRAMRDRRFWMGWHRWHLTMPWFEMIRLPASYVGSELCWRGTVMWEGEGEHFVATTGDGCRDIKADDVGKRIVGVGIKPDTLAMRLTPPWSVRLASFACGILLLIAAAGLVVTLVRVRPGQMLMPAVIVVLSILVIALDDASFLGGVRPFDGGDDGLFYDGVGRLILQKLLAGDFYGALEGGETVFYYGGPGLRYFRALEHIVFGESYLGYLSIILLFPFLVYALFRRFLPDHWSLALILLFVAIPIGTIFGTSFVQYEQWASRGFADPAAYILFIAGALLVVSKSARRAGLVQPFFAALLFALAIFMKPVVAPAAAVLLGGAGIAALYLQQWPRLVGLCIGFLPVFSMALHNWVYGHVFVLFSANIEDSTVLTMPPSAYAVALHDLMALHLNTGPLRKVFEQIADWLGGPAESYSTIPVNAAGIAVLVYVVTRGRQFDPWLRLIGASALAQHAVALFYTAATARYHFLTWLLTMLVVMVWCQRVGIDQLKQRYPLLSERFATHPWSRWLASGLDRLQKVSV
ncbi:MAG TPA: hypothetical protein VLU23_20710 [Pseudolabrys sp.]|nr:hypothetical protein [Pseudolabrys sp.]